MYSFRLFLTGFPYVDQSVLFLEIDHLEIDSGLWGSFEYIVESRHRRGEEDQYHTLSLDLKTRKVLLR